MLTVALQLLTSGVAMGFVYALTAVEYTLIWSSSGLLNFGHEKVIMLDAYILARTIMLNLGTRMIPDVVATLILMALFGVVIAFTIFIPPRHMNRLCTIIATVTIGNIISEAVRLCYGPEAVTVKGFMSSTLCLDGLMVAKTCLCVILISVVIVAVLELFMRKTKTGKAMRCVASSKVATALTGINVQQNMVITVAISFVICGALGMSVIPVLSINSFIATMISLKGFAADVVGEFGSLPGAIVGGLALGIVENIADMVFPSTFKGVVMLVVLIIALLVKPSGLLGKKR